MPLDGGDPMSTISPARKATHPSSGSGVVASSSVATSARPVEPIRQRSSGGVTTVVSNTTRRSAP